MRKKVTLVTGAAGEVGTSLVQSLSENAPRPLLTLDLTPLPNVVGEGHTHIVGDILDARLLSRLVAEYEIETIFHLAALLSTKAEFAPETAHRVNVFGAIGVARQTGAVHFSELDRGLRAPDPRGQKPI